MRKWEVAGCVQRLREDAEEDEEDEEDEEEEDEEEEEKADNDNINNNIYTFNKWRFNNYDEQTNSITKLYFIKSQKN